MITQKEREWLEDHFAKLNDRITDVRIDIAGLKVKSGVWGLIGGLIPVVIMISVYFLTRK